MPFEIYDFKFVGNPEPAFSVRASSPKHAYFLGVKKNPRFRAFIQNDRMTIEPRVIKAKPSDELRCPRCGSNGVITDPDDSSMWRCRRDGWTWDKEIGERVEEVIDELVS